MYYHIKDKSIKLPFETKDSKHLVGKGGDDLNLLPREKQHKLCQMSNYPLQLKNKSISLYLHATRTKQSLPALTIVNVRTLSNQNSLVSSKTFSKN